MKRQFWSGIKNRLPELAVTLIMVAIIAACNTNPAGNGNSVKLYQMEAKSILTQIYNMEQAYYQKHEMYWPNGANYTAVASQRIEELQITIPPFAKYQYSITGSCCTFTAYATSTVLDVDATVDSWTIHENGQLIVTSDDALD
ncbi:MAG: hypothetical protein A2Z27_05790 [candidate division Zixibacteria bacterium RBG_16_50_21]|nr:MAG: hypothetical protein A2Z27_05790 [candidate division Zixibacteria bacterium RBG_16_50_21]